MVIVYMAVVVFYLSNSNFPLTQSIFMKWLSFALVVTSYNNAVLYKLNTKAILYGTAGNKLGKKA